MANDLFGLHCTGASFGKWEASVVVAVRATNIYVFVLHETFITGKYDPMTDVREIALTPRTKNDTEEIKLACSQNKKTHETQCNRNRLGIN